MNGTKILFSDWLVADVVKAKKIVVPPFAVRELEPATKYEVSLVTKDMKAAKTVKFKTAPIPVMAQVQVRDESSCGRLA